MSSFKDFPVTEDFINDINNIIKSNHVEVSIHERQRIIELQNQGYKLIKP